MRLTDEQVKEIQERLSKATPGPWGWQERQAWRRDPRPAVITHTDKKGEWIHGDIAEINDAVFIANAPTDIASLLADREELLGVIDQIEFEITEAIHINMQARLLAVLGIIEGLKNEVRG